MKEIFTEEEYTEAVKKFNEEMMNEFYGKRENYPTYDSYTDLRDYEFSDIEFKILWRCQELLHTYDLAKNQLSNNSRNILENLKNVYSNSFKEEV